MIKVRKLRCSFCRKNESAVAKLVAGPRVYICGECVAIASRIIESGGPKDPKPSNANSSDPAWLVRGRRLWRRWSQSAVVHDAHC